MISEDLSSHVVSLTESIVSREETENLLETLKSKNPDFYEIIFQEIQIEDRLLEIGLEVKQLEDKIAKLSKEHHDDSMNLSRTTDQAAYVLRDLESLQESEVAFRQEILYPKLSVYDKIREALKLLPGNVGEPLLKLINFFKIFDLKS
jgi:hypothetical protein